MALIGLDRLGATLMVAALFVAAPAVAAPITYDESLSGDLPTHSTFPRIPLAVFDFDLGINTISGRLGGVEPFDSFAFVIPEGLELVSASVELVDVVEDVQGAGWWFKRGSTLFDGGSLLQTLVAFSPGGAALDVPRRADTYNLSNFAIQGPNPAEFLADYTFRFEVAPAPVPEPGVLALMSLGLAGIRIFRRRPPTGT